jgi:hypothetical protein
MSLTGIGLIEAASTPVAQAQNLTACVEPLFTPLVSNPLVVSGKLLASAIVPACAKVPPNVPRFVLESDRVTGFMPLYVLGDSRLFSPFIGLDVSITARLTNDVLPDFALIAAGSPVPISPVAIPDFDSTLEETPLTADEEVTLNEILNVLVTAAFFHPDYYSHEMIIDQYSQSLNPEVASRATVVPFISLEDTQGVLRAASFNQLVAAIGGNEEKALQLLILLISTVLSYLLFRISAGTRGAILAEARALFIDANIRALMQSIIMAALQLSRGEINIRQFSRVLENAMKTIAPRFTQTLLRILRTVRWWEYVLAVASTAAIWLKVLKIIESAWSFAAEIIVIARDP